MPSATNDAPALVSFYFVDEGMVGLSRFENYLEQYSGLFALLPAFQLVYVAAKEIHFTGAKKRFERLVNGSTGGFTGPDINSLLEYFEARRLYEAREFAGFDRAKLLRLRDAREQFSGKESEALYERWKTAGADSLRQTSGPNLQKDGPIHGTFSTYLLEQDYECFGYLAGW